MVRGRVENWVVARERFSIWILFSVHARQRTSLGLKGSSQGYCGLDRSHFGGSCVCSRCGAVWRCGGEAGCGGVFVPGRSAKLLATLSLVNKFWKFAFTIAVSFTTGRIQ